MKRIATTILCVLLAGTAFAADDADNTKTNEGDQSAREMTPIDQSEITEHVDLTAKIRRAVVETDGLSLNAKNAKIITTEDTTVYLRGPVDSAAEKSKLEELARTAGASKIKNQLIINTKD